MVERKSTYWAWSQETNVLLLALPLARRMALVKSNLVKFRFLSCKMGFISFISTFYKDLLVKPNNISYVKGF